MFHLTQLYQLLKPYKNFLYFEIKSFDSMPTIVGFFPEIAEGDVYTFKGQVVTHPKYGKPYKNFLYFEIKSHQRFL
jgi:ATP-dependent exoDNAse (exonuclease V) alpha subunit